MTAVSVHQPDFLPYAGYWAKLVSTDAHIVMAGCKNSKGSYLNRVKMGGMWVTVPMVGGTKGMIRDIEIEPSTLLSVYAKIKHVYSWTPWYKRLDPLLQLIAMIAKQDNRNLAITNTRLNMMVLEILGHKPKIIMDGEDMVGESTQERLFNLIRTHVPDVSCYYSGKMGGAYIKDPTPFVVVYPRPNHAIEDESILKVLCTTADPRAYLLDSYTWRTSM
jgi:hypothetical protein